MKKLLTALLMLAIAATAVACGSDDSTTTAATTTAAVTTKAETSKKAETTTAAPEAGTTTEASETTTAPVTDSVDTPVVEPTTDPLTWVDNNGDKVYYVITANDDGTVHVDYTKETAAEAQASWGYSWVNMAADVSAVYTGQSKFVMTVKGLPGETLLIKPFDNQAIEQTVTFDGSEQSVVFDLSAIADPASKFIILFGEGGATDVSSSFDIIAAGFAE